jgi:hypothetical protein
MICCGEALLPVVLGGAPLVAEALDDALGDSALDTLPVETGL